METNVALRRALSYGADLRTRDVTKLSIAQIDHLALMDQIDRLLDCLERLVDYQNGCPLPSYEKEWGRAMADAAALLGRNVHSANGEPK